jgi:phage terminase large subunit GpA-like protein
VTSAGVALPASVRALWMPPMNLPAAVRALWAPPPRLAPSQWAEKYRRLPESSAARGALWSNEAQPALVGIMDAAVETGVREIALVKAAQCGGSETIANLLGYLIHLAPCPVLLAHPTYDGVVEWIKETFDDVIRATPELRARVRDRRAPRHAPGREHHLPEAVPRRLPRGRGRQQPERLRAPVVPRGYRGRRFPPAAVGGRGGRPGLAAAAAHGDVAGRALHLRVDPHAGRRHHRPGLAAERPAPVPPDVHGLRAGGLRHLGRPQALPRRVRGRGPEHRAPGVPCGVSYDEGRRRQMVRVGRWIATAEGKPGCAGFHLPRTISLLGNATLPNLVSAWLAARKEGREALRTFVNTALGEPWEERDSPKIEPHVLLGRRERYDAEEVPAAASVLTAGVDVQANRVELQVVAWGLRLERWVIAYETIPGDPRRRETWDELSRRLAATFKHPTGHQLGIHATCVDSGHLADEVYGFAMANQHRRIFATKGESHGTAEPLFMRFSERTYGKNARPVRLGRLNVDAGKAELSSALNLPPGNPMRRSRARSTSATSSARTTSSS